MRSPFKSGGKLHWIRNLYKRWRYGAGCCDIYNLDYYLAKQILPALKQFREHVGSYPGDLKNFEEWQAMLDEMIWAFQWLIDGEEYDRDVEEYKKLVERQTKGFELFGQRFRGLWF